MLVSDELPISGVGNESMKSSSIWVIVLSFQAEYSRNLFNLRSDILKFNALFFILAYTTPLHLCYHNSNKGVMKSVESSDGGLTRKKIGQA